MKRIYPDIKNIKKPIVKSLVLICVWLLAAFVCWVFRLNPIVIFSFLGVSVMQTFWTLLALPLARSYYLKDKGTIIYCDRKNEEFRVVASNTEVTVKFCDLVDMTLHGTWGPSYIPYLSEFCYFKIRTIDGKEILLTSYFLKYDFFDDEYFEDLFLRNVELKRKFNMYPIIFSVFRK
jgi:hypothetical protein